MQSEHSKRITEMTRPIGRMLTDPLLITEQSHVLRIEESTKSLRSGVVISAITNANGKTEREKKELFAQTAECRFLAKRETTNVILQA